MNNEQIRAAALEEAAAEAMKHAGGTTAAHAIRAISTTSTLPEVSICQHAWQKDIGEQDDDVIIRCAKCEAYPAAPDSGERCDPGQVQTIRERLTNAPAAPNSGKDDKVYRQDYFGDWHSVKAKTAAAYDARLATPAAHSSAPSDERLIAAVDAAMVEMANITPPLRRSECKRLILAALAAPSPTVESVPVQVSECLHCGKGVPEIDICEDGRYCNIAMVNAPTGASK